MPQTRDPAHLPLSSTALIPWILARKKWTANPKAVEAVLAGKTGLRAQVTWALSQCPSLPHDAPLVGGPHHSAHRCQLMPVMPAPRGEVSQRPHPASIPLTLSMGPVAVPTTEPIPPGLDKRFMQIRLESFTPSPLISRMRS